jgi:two-component system cell cycle sensor histidine kinase/response regulator CckA
MANEYAGPIDVVLTDIVMPGMSGADVADRFQQLRAGIRVLFMSGYAGDILNAHGQQHQGAASIEKPFTPAALAAKVREVLEKADTNRASLRR